MTTGAEIRHATALKWFEVHAGQRMQLLAGYLAGIGLASGGIGTALSAKLPWAATAICVFLISITIVFWFLDRRTMQLIHVGEDAIQAALSEFGDKHFNVIAESGKKDRRVSRRTMSYRKSIGLLFVSTILFSILAVVVAWCGEK